MLDLFCAETDEKALKRKDRRISFIRISDIIVEAKIILIPLSRLYEIKTCFTEYLECYRENMFVIFKAITHLPSVKPAYFLNNG